jgi:hypothetical protein
MKPLEHLIVSQSLTWLIVIGLSDPCHGVEAESPRVPLIKLPGGFNVGMENTPFVFQGRTLLALNHRDDTKYNQAGYKDSMYLYIRDLVTGQEITRFGKGHSFVNAFVDDDRLHVFASEGTDHHWFQSIYHFSTSDLTQWERKLAIEKDGDEHLFNCSIVRDDQGYVMAFESNQPTQFCFKFARSVDLDHWKKVPQLVFAGENGREYSACPVLRYFKPYYYVIYLHAATAGRQGWVSFVARSSDLTIWELSPCNPILAAEAGEGVNNSDVDLFELKSRTYLFYGTGDQATWSSLRIAMYDGPMEEFFQKCFPAEHAEGMVTVRTRQ